MQEIETQAILAQQQINVVKSQIATKNRDMRLLQLTSTELSTLSQDTPIFEGVGKMYGFLTRSVEYFDHWRLLTRDRFVFSPPGEIEKRLSTETVTLGSDIENLGKKLHYLETTHKNSREHIDQIFKNGGR